MGGVGRIYFTAIDRYAERFGLTDDQFERFRIFIRAMDEEYVLYVREKQEEEIEKNKTDKPA
jgi:hypothetical protein